jgi:SDR family mycofactocin-dependent oxidoreductase
MAGRLAGKTALITGAARGMGRVHAVTFAREGADVIAVDIAGPLPEGVTYASSTSEDLAETVRLVEEAGARIVAEIADIRDRESLGAAIGNGVAQFGRLDTVVANAGITVVNPWDAISDQEFADVMNVNVIGTWNTVKAAVPHIIDGGRGGSVILISSRAGLTLQPFMVHYTASKHAVTGMARALAAELGQHRIRVNSVHPGTVDTILASPAIADNLVEAINAAPHLASVGTPFLPEYLTHPQDVANAVLFLASDESSSITATAMAVDKGATFG